ncbi:MAG: hypothetical protein CW691_05185 [Candidatus Bathyarchaeum sp.]|nr:MAG: hypothetical protein CW691_05185 [Candidatus Bathyarchaeum sp.]
MNDLEINPNHVSTLTSLGLTQSQARVFLAIAQHESISPKKISEITKIATPHIYLILDELDEIGIIEKSLEKPVSIRALPIHNTIKFLVERKHQQILSLNERAEELVQAISKDDKKTNPISPRSQFIWINKKDPYIRKRHEMIYNTKKSIKFIMNWERFPRVIFNFGDSAIDALKRNVQIQVILEKPKNSQSIDSIIHEHKKYSNYQIRYTDEPPHATVAIFDESKAVIDVSITGELANEPALWTDNPCVTSVFLDYFHILWTNSSEIIN